jgi:hypothetical protein
MDDKEEKKEWNQGSNREYNETLNKSIERSINKLQRLEQIF